MSEQDLIQQGRDEMADALGELLAGLDPEEDGQGYVDGVEDALFTLINHGASDPR